MDMQVPLNEYSIRIDDTSIIVTKDGKFYEDLSEHPYMRTLLNQGANAECRIHSLNLQIKDLTN